MRSGDSRERGGPGILPLQAHHKRWDLDMRPFVAAWRLVDRLDADDQLGHWVYDDKTPGDINGGQFWEQDGEKRPIPMWRFSTPVVTVPAQGMDVVTGQSSVCQVMSKSAILPIRNNGDTGKYIEDDRFKPITVPEPERDGKKMWPKFPVDFMGISLVADEEYRQENLFFPADPRLVSVQRKGDAKMGTLVCDMGDGFKIDLDRMARLQSVFKVAKKPEGIVDFYKENSIAISIKKSHCGDVRGGLVWDDVIAGGGTHTQVEGGVESTAYGLMSNNQSGPFDVGGPGSSCQHPIGKDADGVDIHALHLSTRAYFKRPGSAQDGPLDFTVWKKGEDKDPIVPVYLGWGPGSHHFIGGQKGGLWKWWTTTAIYTPGQPPRIPPDTPTDRPSTDPPDVPTGGSGEKPPELPPGTQETLTGDKNLALLRKMQHRDKSDVSVATQAAYQEFGVPAMNFRALHWDVNQVDYRYEPHPGNQGLAKLDKKHPIVARMDVWAQQVGNLFSYNETFKKGKYFGGSANGGICFVNPEVGLEDLGTSLAPDDTSKNTCYINTAPGVFWSSGLPDTSTGAIKTGYRWTSSAAGVVSFDKVDSSGTVTANALVLTQDSAPRVGVNISTPKSYLDVGGSFGAAVETIAIDTLLDETHHTVLCDGSARTANPTLPAASGCEGRIYEVMNVGSVGSITVARTGSDTINGATSYALTSQYNSAVFKSDGANWYAFART